MNYSDSQHLRPSAKYPVYPPYHTGLYLEEYFFNFVQNKDLKKEYIPVFWTNCYVNSSIGQGKYNIQEYLNTLDTDKEYFTVAQHDDFPNEHLPNNTTKFVAGGRKIIYGTLDTYVPIPLICSPIIPQATLSHSTKNDRPILASFIGSITHPIRQSVAETLCRMPKKYRIITKNWTPQVSKLDLEVFLIVTKKSKFTLCPRGYGLLSFRIFEAMQLGSIPVIISDVPSFLPFMDTIDWTSIAVIISDKDIHKIDQILSSIPEEKQEEMRYNIMRIYPQYFTLEATCNQILARI